MPGVINRTWGHVVTNLIADASPSTAIARIITYLGSDDDPTATHFPMGIWPREEEHAGRRLADMSSTTPLTPDKTIRGRRPQLIFFRLISPDLSVDREKLAIEKSSTSLK